ncbi:MAG: hypothetical protein K2J97_06135, partial [Muribaculaceae bacterium]|nr:hypothetical protein [Muribaculaceae bacterium]
SMHHRIFIFIIGALFAAIAVVFSFFPRPAFSELERRDLSRFPEFSIDALIDGSFMEAVSSWFSDSEPFRDELMTASMQVRHLMSYHPGDDEDAVTFHGNGTVAMDDDETDEIDDLTAAPPVQVAVAVDSLAVAREVSSADSSAVTPVASDSGEGVPIPPSGVAPGIPQLVADDGQPYVPAVEENAKLGNSGIIIVGSGDNVRALMAYGGSPKSGRRYASTLNLYKETFGPSVNIYSMVVPLATEYYCPEKARKTTRPIFPVIKAINDSLRGVVPVDAYGALAAHVDEPIFFRTDHHWAPLGAYYAAQDFAKKAGVPFLPLESYEADTIHRFVGTMYGYSKDISVKKAPEDFIYYKPQGVDYQTTYVIYHLNENYHIVSETKPFKSSYFKKFSDGASGAYCTFMGGDQCLVKVETSTKNGRKLVILKDSYGNAVPSFLFGSFEEVHVIDFRYFTRNIVDYVRDNGITDMLFVHNIFNVSGSAASSAYRRFLTQKSAHTSSPSHTSPSPAKPASAVADTVPAETKPALSDSLPPLPPVEPFVLDTLPSSVEILPDTIPTEL